MNMPGFTGEQSLYKTHELYHMRSIDAIATGQIVPQAARSCVRACLSCAFLGNRENCKVCSKCLD